MSELGCAVGMGQEGGIGQEGIARGMNPRIPLYIPDHARLKFYGDIFSKSRFISKQSLVVCSVVGDTESAKADL